MSDRTPIIVEPASKGSGDGRWEPNIGPEILDFLENIVPKNSRDSVRDDAASILAKGIDPTIPSGQETGLVVGYVQSGKTMSFEAVAALARDNAFQIVIVVAGISNPLLQQSTGRLRRDLGLDDPDRARRWVLFDPPYDDATVRDINNVLEDWRDSGIPKSEKNTILITVLKHHKRLKDLVDLVRDLDVRRVPVLIIDDEADQASLNTEVAQNDESATYRRLMELRQALSNHTYLQYTATPQAPLLISIIDSLSPNFVQVLEPGDAYVGGREFFADNRYIRVVPLKDVPGPNNPLSEPPETLLEALRTFMLGVAAGLLASQDTDNRSMLVHPSHRTALHQKFYDWINNITEGWQRILKLPGTDPDRQELIEEFRNAYANLAKTAESDLPAFDKLETNLSRAFRKTRVLKVNASSGETPQVNWRNSYGWILVGGQAMDRGFTVEGLTVTYMPRGIGGGNADTVQQRARFFGYKRQYLGYCRLYLDQGTLNAFRSYVDHEEDIRKQLKNFQQTGRPLNEWKRAFVLDTALRPCRSQVLEFDYIRGLISGWVNPKIVLASNDVVQDNLKVVDEFVNTLEFVDDEGHPERTDAQCHEVCRKVPLRDAIKQLLVQMRINDIADSQQNSSMLIQLGRALDSNPNEVCTVYRMSPRTGRSRSVDENGKVKNIFQGKDRIKPEKYPGDREIRDQDNVTIQIHMIDLKQNNKEIMKNVPVIAVWIPERLARPLIIQDQPLQD